MVIFSAAVVSGVQFPLLVALLGKADRAVGRQVGTAFAWNTLGAIAGSLAGGFGILPWLGAPSLVRLVVLLCDGALAASPGDGYGIEFAFEEIFTSSQRPPVVTGGLYRAAGTS